MSTTIDTFIYLQRDIEQSFQRVQKICNSSQYDQQELDQLFNHISCTLDDLQKVNQLLHSSSTPEHQSVNIPLSESENEFEEENRRFISPKRNIQISIKDQAQKRFTLGYSKENEEPLLTSNSTPSNNTADLLPSSDERDDFIVRMKTELTYYKNRIQQIKKESPMEIIRLDQAPEEDEDNEDRKIRKQDEQLEDIHFSIISFKNLTQNINFEIDDHIRILDNLETGMINNQNDVANLTNRTKTFLQTSTDGIGGHTCLFIIAVGLFFLIVILILFF